MYNTITTFDIETTGLRGSDNLSMHCLYYSIDDLEGNHIKHGGILDMNKAIDFLNKQECIAGHNILVYDIPVLEDMSGRKITTKGKIDTLALSWYLFQKELVDDKWVSRKLHGLDDWGRKLGIKKPKIEDWKSGTIEEYKQRCKTDVQINRRFLFQKCLPLLREIYNEPSNNNIFRPINYLNFKMECMREQEENPLTIDIPHCEKTLEKLNIEIGEKSSELAKYMPSVPKVATYKKPKTWNKADGSLSAHAIKWIQRFDSKEEAIVAEEIEIIKSYDAPNPNSTDQLKSWLFTLGWKPEIYKDSTSKVTGETKKVPQLYNDKKKVCDSIKKLYDKHPYLKELEGLSILKHRKGVFEGFLSLNRDGKVIASAGGFTNTLRLAHRKPIANLVKTNKPYGKEVRGAIIAPKGMILCGSDMSALEDTTKQHYMYYFDPDYVNEMRVKGFDPHLDISMLAEMMTKEEADLYKELKYILEDTDEDLTEEQHKEFDRLDNIRGNAKTVNFGGVYGAGPAKMDETLKKGLAFTTKLHKVYWERNKAVKIVAENVHYKEVRGQLWLYNPVSKLWLNLRNTKDIFSVLNQSTGVYCFDTWVRILRKKGIKISLQYHDEIGFYLPDSQQDKDNTRLLISNSVESLNNKIKLNVPLGVSAKYGNNYAETH